MGEGAVRKSCAIAIALTFGVAACSGSDSAQQAQPTGAPESSVISTTSATATTDTVAPDPTVPGPGDVTLYAGASSNTILPTVNGDHSYMADSPGWGDVEPNDIGVFVPTWDQGRIDVGNGNEDAAWVHDDLRTTALALRRGNQLVVMATADVYMIFAADAAEIERRARALLPPDLSEIAEIVISATHNHHGPDTAFSVNDEWYEVLADQMAGAIYDAATLMEPASGGGERRPSLRPERRPRSADRRPAIERVARGVRRRRRPHHRHRRAVGQPPRDDARLGAPGRLHRAVRRQGLGGRRLQRRWQVLHGRLPGHRARACAGCARWRGAVLQRRHRQSDRAG